ncbi:MAG: hypothetical protein KC940_01560, partial [Candidatus Omnitrophica bacterium]|nr:hypothetical protein [Candidatus Omnitrophota bacterium]
LQFVYGRRDGAHASTGTGFLGGIRTMKYENYHYSGEPAKNTEKHKASHDRKGFPHIRNDVSSNTHGYLLYGYPRLLPKANQ